ncbi:MAG: hypothetical protein ACHQNE_05880 [Candidatus Kapaibacterium sp.]
MATKVHSRTGPAARKSAKRPRAVKAPKEEPASAREFLLAVAERANHLPAEVRAKVPKDASKNLDQYLYGHSKRE